MNEEDLSSGLWLAAQSAADSSIVEHFFRGQMDEVRLSSIARYRSNFQPELRFTPDEHTLVLYHCDELSGNKLIDASGNGYHGIAVDVEFVTGEIESIAGRPDLPGEFVETR